jgi:hypothetical protein
MGQVTLVSGPPQATLTLTRGSTNPTTIVNAPAVTVALSRQVGDGAAATTFTTDLAAIYALAAN